MESRQSLNPDDLQDVLDSAKNAGRKGVQQFLTPPHLAAALALPMPRHRAIAADFTCGTGALLRGLDARTCLGVDIDSRAANACADTPHAGHTQSWQTQTADFTLLYDLLAESDCRFDLLALNPPFSLQWDTKRFAALAKSDCEAVRATYKCNAASLDSTLATLLAALDRLSERGEGYMILNEATAIRLLGEPGQSPVTSHQSLPAAALRRHVWLWVSLPEGTFDAAFAPCVLYFARSHHAEVSAPIFHVVSPSPNPSAVLAPMAGNRVTLRRGMCLHHDTDFSTDTVSKWRACLHELRVRNGAKATHPFNLWIEGGKIKRHLTPFQGYSGRIPKKDAEALNALDGQSPFALVMQKPTRLALLRAVKGAIWRVDPALLAAVDAAMSSYHAARAPLYPPTKVQSIGWLDEQDAIRCLVDLTEKPYTSGTNTNGRPWHEARMRMVMGKKDASEWSGFRRNLGANKKHEPFLYVEEFEGEAEALEWLLEGAKPDTAPAFLAGETYPLHTASRIIERQHDRPNAVTGKLEKCTLHGQELVIRIFDAKGRAHEFGDYSEEERTKASGTVLHPIEDLANHFDIPQVADVAKLHPEKYQRALALLDWLDGSPGNGTAHPSLNAPPTFSVPCDAETSALLGKIQAAMHNNGFTFRGYQKDDLARACCVPGDDTGRPGIRCLSRPTLATLCMDLFGRDAYVGCDEAVRLKSNDSYTSLGVRRLSPEFRMVLTGTPIKNHLDDIFWLLKWAAGSTGCIMGWEPGLGKTVPLLLFGILNGARRHLLVVPESLHDQVCKEALDKFGIPIRRLNSQRDLAQDALLQECQRDVLNGRRSEVRGVWITSYSQLGFNGADEWVGKEDEDGDIVVSSKCQSEREAWPGWKEEFDKRIGTCGEKPHSMARLSEATARFPYSGTNADKEKFAREFMLMEQNHTREQAADDAGKKRPARKRVPVLCNIHRLWKLLGPLVIRRRKDDVPGCDIVPKTIVPLRCRPGSAQHAVYEHHLRNKPQFTKDGRPMNPISAILAQLTCLRLAALCPDSDLLKIRRVHLHKVKTLLKPKPAANAAEAADRAKVTDKAIKVARLADRTPFEAERETAFDLLSKMLLGDIPVDIEELCKAAPSLAQRIRDAVEVEVEPPAARSWTDHNPKQAAILAKIAELIAQGEQVVVMAPFQDFGRSLQRRLEEAGVASLLLDGNTAPAKRGRFALLFKQRKYPVLIGGVESMGEGHSFENASHLILPSITWALDKNLQAMDRVHRLNSKKPVTIYFMVTENTIDERLEKLFHEKGDAAGLALDGRIRPEDTAEINLAQLLLDAVRNFDPDAPTISEQDIEAQWESELRQRLGVAMAGYRQWHPPVDQAAPVTQGEITAAMKALSLPSVGEPIQNSAFKIQHCRNLLKAVPDNTLRFLLNSPAAASVAAERESFEAYAAQHSGHWRQLWGPWMKQYGKRPTSNVQRPTSHEGTSPAPLSALDKLRNLNKPTQ